MSVPDASPADLEQSTQMALEEKQKLIKSMRRFDMLFFTICALVGLDTLGQVSGYGAQTFTWLIVLAVMFVLPYALLMAEFGSALHPGGRPIRVDEARRGAASGRASEPSSTGSRTRSGSAARWRSSPPPRGATTSPTSAPGGRSATTCSRRSSSGSASASRGLAAARQVDPQRRRDRPRRRARRFSRSPSSSTASSTASTATPLGTSSGRARPCSSAWCRCCCSTTSDSSSRTAPPRRWSTRRRTCPSRSDQRRRHRACLRHSDLRHPRGAADQQDHRYRRIPGRRPHHVQRVRRRAELPGRPDGAWLHLRADHVGQRLDDGLRPDPGGGLLRRRPSCRGSGGSTATSAPRCG